MIKRVLSVLAVLLLFGVIGAQQRPRVITVPTDPAGDACTVSDPPYLLIWMNGEVQQTYSCQASQWQLASTLAKNVQGAEVIADTRLRGPNLYSTNASTVTVCAGGGCDYETVQAAVNNTSGTKVAPITIHIMPGTYNECVDLRPENDYTTLYAAPRTAVINCAEDDLAVIEIDLQGVGTPTYLEGFSIYGLTLQADTTQVSYGFLFKGGQVTSAVPQTIVHSAVDVTIDTVWIRDPLLAGVSYWPAETDDPPFHSSMRVVNSRIELPGTGIRTRGAVMMWLENNIILLDGKGLGQESKCIGDHQVNNTWRRTYMFSRNNYCRAWNKNVQSELDCVGGIVLYRSHQTVTSDGDYFETENLTGPAAFGPCGISIGTPEIESPQGTNRVYVTDATIKLTCKTGQQCRFVSAAGNARIRVKGLNLIANGPGTFTRFRLFDNSWTRSYLLYQDTNTLTGINDVSAGKGTLSEAP